MSAPRNVLLVANRTASTPGLEQAVVRRAARGTERFHLVVPAVPQGLHRLVDPEVAGREEAERRLNAALRSLGEAVEAEVTGEVGDADPVAAIQDALSRAEFEEIVVSTLPRRVSRWLRIDLPSKARGLGLPVAHVEARHVPDEQLLEATPDGSLGVGGR